MDPGLAIDVITSAGSAITAAGRAAPDAPVAHCPTWAVSSVVKHVGAVHTWVEATVRMGSVEMQPFGSAPDLSGDALTAWADDARSALVATLAAADPEHHMWTMAGTGPAGFWWRRQCHETAI